jgi:hypothetical protein
MQRNRKLLPILLICSLLAAQISSAFATILFAGGEDLDVSLIGGTTVSTGATTFRSGYARSSLGVSNAAITDPPGIRIVTTVFANQATIWVHAENFSNGGGTTSGFQPIGIYGSDGVRRLLLRGTGTANQVKISTRNTAGTITDLVTCTLSAYPTTSLTKVDWFINYAVAGRATLYAAGVQICDYSGDITTNSVTAVNQVDFANFGSTVGTFWSEIIVATTDTRDMNLATCAPQANGTNQTWTGTASNVNPTTINDASAITTATSNAIAEFTCPSLPAGTFTVPAVVQSARVQIGSTGPQNYRFIARPGSGSTDYDSGADIVGSTSFANSGPLIWATNPAGGAWSTGDLGAGTNFGLKSRP